MEERRLLRRREPVRGEQLPVLAAEQLRPRERPGLVLDPGAVQPAAPRRVQAVALRQKEVERFGFGSDKRSSHLPDGRELRRRGAGVRAPRAIVDAAPLLPQAHPRQEVREPEEEPPSRDQEGVGGVQREEPHPRHPVQVHVGAHVQLVRPAQQRERRQPRVADSPHGEGDQADPCRAVVHVQGQPLREQWPEHRLRNPPVHEEELPPPLVVDGAPRRAGADGEAVDHLWPDLQST